MSKTKIEMTLGFHLNVRADGCVEVVRRGVIEAFAGSIDEAVVKAENYAKAKNIRIPALKSVQKR